MISCICNTYDRYPRYGKLLEECVYWYTQQDYTGESELIILNDAPNQKLKCDVEGVRVVNTPMRFPSLGDKHNALVALARGDIILVWDDDDISLPNRISESVKALGTSYDYWNPQKTWFEQVGQMPRHDTHGVNHNTSAYRRGLFCYKPTNDQDVQADLDCKKHRVAPEGNVRVYVYRWGVSNWHISGMGGKWNRGTYPEPGEFEIVPKMYYDYGRLM